MNRVGRIGILMIFAVMVVFTAVRCSFAADIQEKVRTAMKMLQSKAADLGGPKIDGSTLYFGETEINGYYDIVDDVADNNGCTATIFMAKAGGYQRISTNVIRDGNRAIGTVLDPNGEAFKKIQTGEAFYGEAVILGERYQTGYEPIRDESGKIVGILYVGFKM